MGQLQIFALLAVLVEVDAHTEARGIVGHIVSPRIAFLSARSLNIQQGRAAYAVLIGKMDIAWRGEEE
jgi:molybdopterin-binding protein